MHDITRYEQFLELNPNDLGYRIKANTPDRVRKELKDFDEDYFRCYQTHFFREFRVNGDGDIIVEAEKNFRNQ